MIVIARQAYDPVADLLVAQLGAHVRSFVVERWLETYRTRHIVGGAGWSTEIRTAIGESVFGADSAIVLNRVGQMCCHRFLTAGPTEHAYALAEATALYWSILSALPCQVLNTPSVLGLVGRPPDGLTLAALAQRCGLPTRSFCLTTRARNSRGSAMLRVDSAWGWPPAGWGSASDSGPARFETPPGKHRATIWVVGDQLAGTLEGISPSAVLALARQLGLGFGVFHFECSDMHAWRFIGMDALPDRTPALVLEKLGDYLQSHVTPLAEEMPA